MDVERTRPDEEWLAAGFEQQRPHLRRIAYRMLGSISDADDAVQEAWFRLSKSGAAVDNLGAWLTTVVGRISLDMLRARRARREDAVGSWLPEPVVAVDDETPEEQTLVADSVGLALLVVLEVLTPSERIAFVLHDMFGVSFEEIAPIVGRTPAASRQLASRARRRVRGAPLNDDADLAGQREVVAAFLAASRAGDFDGLIAVLDPGVVFRADTGDGPRARPPVEGATAVAERVLRVGRPLAGLARPALVNGGAGLLVGRPGRPFAVAAFTIAGGRIVAIDLITDGAKLRHVTGDRAR
jgi:RNA polymerase sigma-70 factor, ECF subfamily